MKRKIIIATIKSWNIKNALKFKNKYKNRYSVKIISKKEDLCYEEVNKYSPEYIFFPHWSWMIPEEIYKNFECIVFHMTDLPFGRGGSPLQNLILRGFKKTKISAIRVVKELDAGPVYIKKSLSLSDSAQEIYERASRIIFEDMIPHIIIKKPEPVLQKGEVTIFNRRKPEESRIPDNLNLEGAYDFIRMLDAEEYPFAFIDTEKLIFEFKNAKKYKDFISAKVSIKEKK